MSLERAPAALSLLARHPVPQAVLRAARGVACHLVGGVLRDRLLGLGATDFDAIVERDGRGIGERLAAELGARLVPLGGKAFAAYRLAGADFSLDLWDREGAALASDLARRDFTVNAFAYDLAAQRLVDPHEGLRDLERRLLRATTPASFSGDPLRVLRLARLLVQLPGFTVDPPTVSLARAAAPGVAGVAAERVREELARLMASPDAHRGVALLDNIAIYPGLWLGRPGEPIAGSRSGAAVDEMERLAGAALALRQLALGWADEADLAAARWAIAFAHLPGDGEPRAALQDFAAAGYLPRRQADRVAQLLPWSELPAAETAQRRFLHAASELWPTAAVYLGARAARRGRFAAWQQWLAEVVSVLERTGGAILDPPALISGEEVQDLLGIGPGPEVGRVLARVREAQVDGRVGTRDEALALLRDAQQR
jgi:tRNA nucleotidyltransferase/poly(A) polymerase